MRELENLVIYLNNYFIFVLHVVTIFYSDNARRWTRLALSCRNRISILTQSYCFLRFEKIYKSYLTSSTSITLRSVLIKSFFVKKGSAKKVRQTTLIIRRLAPDNLYLSSIKTAKTSFFIG